MYVDQGSFANGIVRACNLVPRYGQRAVTKPLCFELKAGEVGVLIGANGCGKTTVLRSVLGELEYDGSLEVLSASPIQGRPWRMIERGLSFIPQFPIAPNFFTIEQFILTTMWSQRLDSRKILEKIETMARARRSKLIGELSYGQRRLVEILNAVGSNQKLLLADEPFAALASFAAKEVCSLLASFLESGGSVLMSAHRPDLNMLTEAWRLQVVAA